ncbi:MAG TPA: amidase, partial [Acidocella sp.]|nr:amidase [Acidocella sp.]
MSLTDLTIAQAGAKLAAKEISAVELTAAHNAAVAALNPRLNAFITTTPELALEQAKAADAVIAAGKAGPLTGIPLAIKDLFCTEGVRTTAASKILEPFIPPYESTVTAQLKAAGAICLGKANLDEFAMGSSNITSGYGPVENPWKRNGSDAKLVPGGSSGGSAAAVAARLALGATGTDTGGSIRQPASFTGLAGIKPTYGRCSRYGIIA